MRDKPETFDDVIKRTFDMAGQHALNAAIEICRSMDGSCNQCCADAIERFRNSVYAQDNKAPTLNS